MNKRNHRRMTIADRDECTKIAERIKKRLERDAGSSFSNYWGSSYWYAFEKGYKERMNEISSLSIRYQYKECVWETLVLIAQGYHKRRLVMPDEVADWASENLERDRKLPRKMKDTTFKHFAMYKAVVKCKEEGYRPLYSEDEICVCEGIAIAWPKENSKEIGETLGARTVYDAYKERIERS